MVPRLLHWQIETNNTLDSFLDPITDHGKFRKSWRIHVTHFEKMMDNYHLGLEMSDGHLSKGNDKKIGWGWMVQNQCLYHMLHYLLDHRSVWKQEVEDSSWFFSTFFWVSFTSSWGSLRCKALNPPCDIVQISVQVWDDIMSKTIHNC